MLTPWPSWQGIGLTRRQIVGRWVASGSICGHGPIADSRGGEAGEAAGRGGEAMVRPGNYGYVDKLRNIMFLSTCAT